MNTEYWRNDTHNGKQKYTDGNQSQSHKVYHISHRDLSEIKTNDVWTEIDISLESLL
jgi:hypothetical protein